MKLKNSLELEQLYQEISNLSFVLATLDRERKGKDSDIISGRLMMSNEMYSLTKAMSAYAPKPKNVIKSAFESGKSWKITDVVINIVEYTYLLLDSQKALDIINLALLSPLAEQKYKKGLFHTSLCLFHAPLCREKLIKFKNLLEKCIQSDNDELQAKASVLHSLQR